MVTHLTEPSARAHRHHTTRFVAATVLGVLLATSGAAQPLTPAERVAIDSAVRAVLSERAAPSAS